MVPELEVHVAEGLPGLHERGGLAGLREHGDRLLELRARPFVVADRAVMEVFTPGTHGSTFGGNPLACAVGREVIAWMNEGILQRRVRTLGWTLRARLEQIAERTQTLSGVRSRGLWAGLDIGIPGVSGRDVAEAMLRRNVIVKDTHGQTLRLSPPLIIPERDLLWALDELEAALLELAA